MTPTQIRSLRCYGYVCHGDCSGSGLISRVGEIRDRQISREMLNVDRFISAMRSGYTEAAAIKMAEATK